MKIDEFNDSGRRLRRVGVVGDIHCEDEALTLVLRHFSELHIEIVLSVGDIVDGAGDPNRVCSLLAEHGVLTVLGNHDRWALHGTMRDLPGATAIDSLSGGTRAWLAQLPKTRSFKTAAGPLLLCHGFGTDDMAGLRPDDEGYALRSNLALQTLIKEKRYRFVVNGHTHLPMVRNIGRLIIINAGTLDHRDRQVCSVIDFDRGNVELYDVDRSRISKTRCVTMA